MFSRIEKVADEMWRYNVAGKFATLKPRALMAVLTYRCNSRCIMCNIWKRKPGKEMGFEQWDKVFDDEYLKEIETLTVSGGEGMLYPDYLRTVKMMIEKLPKLQRLMVNTNGFLPELISDTVEEVAKICKKKKIRLDVSVSLDGVGREHDRVRRVKDGFVKVSKTLDKLNKIRGKYDIGIAVAGVLMRSNLEKYWDYKKWLQENKLNYSFQLVGFHKTYVGNKNSKKGLDFDGTERQMLNKVLLDMKNENKSYGLMNMFWDDMKQMYDGGRRHTPCPYLVDDMVVDSMGDVYYCLSARKIGNILEEGRSVGEIYSDKKNIKWRKEMWNKECRKCNSSCDVVRAIAGEAKKFGWYRLSGRLI